MKYNGSCHCGAVQFEVEADAHLLVEECNCSICSKSGYLHLIVPSSRFELIEGRQNLGSYRFNSGIAAHTFCKTCGIKAFYTPRSNPDGIAVNVRCLDTAIEQITINPFDGRNWEQNAGRLAHLSQE